MATPAYVPLDPNKPDGTTQSPADYAASDLANVRAFRDGLVGGFAPGWTFAYDGSAWPVSRFTFASGTLRVRLQVTNTAATYHWNATRIYWEWSNDSGASYAPMSTGGADANLTVNAGGGITAMDRDASIIALIFSALNRSEYAASFLNAHAALVGTAAHGLGTMSTQNANAVAIAGGAVANCNINGANISGSALNGAYRVYPAAPQPVATGQPWDWANGSTHYRANPGCVISFIQNPQQGEVKRIYVPGPGAITINNGGGVTFTWAAGHPVFGPGATLVTFCALENNFILGTTIGL